MKRPRNCQARGRVGHQPMFSTAQASQLMVSHSLASVEAFLLLHLVHGAMTSRRSRHRNYSQIVLTAAFWSHILRPKGPLMSIHEERAWAVSQPVRRWNEYILNLSF